MNVISINEFNSLNKLNTNIKHLEFGGEGGGTYFYSGKMPTFYQCFVLG